MPTGGSGGEYQTLSAAITGSSSSYYGGENAIKIQEALSTPFSSYFYSGRISDVNDGFFWTSTKSIYDRYSMYYVDFYQSNVGLEYYSDRGHGYSIRCLLK